MSAKPRKKGVPKPTTVAGTTKPIVDAVRVAKASKPEAASMLFLSIMLVVLCFIVYGNTLNNGFVFDDNVVIRENALVHQGLGGVAEIFKTPHLKGYANLPNDTYRPLSLAVFALEYQAFGDNAAKWHFINVLVFAGCALLLFRFLRTLFQGRHTLAAFVATLIFVAHPIHTEGVANLKSLDELLCFFFAFLALYFFQNFSKLGNPLSLIHGAV
jgi:hypothetical protein